MIMFVPLYKSKKMKKFMLAASLAAALILFAIVFTITYINLTFSRNKVQYM